jgi:hypothetical protein
MQRHCETDDNEFYDWPPTRAEATRMSRIGCRVLPSRPIPPHTPAGAVETLTADELRRHADPDAPVTAG